MAFLNSISALTAQLATTVAAPNKMWHVLILKAFGWIGDYGWSIVVFTILLKLVLSPLDFYQRYKMHKNQKITERLKPTMEKIQRQYGNDKQAFAQKQMELNRKEGYSYFSSCLPMIATMVVFITLWLSMNTVGQYMTFKEYITLYDEYKITYSQVSEEVSGTRAEEISQDVVFNLYYNGIDQAYVQKIKSENGLTKLELQDQGKVQASFLWIKNIWAPDVPWGNRAILDWSSFVTATGGAGKKYNDAAYTGLDSETFGDAVDPATYGKVMKKLINDSSRSKANGYLILPILVVLLSVGSQILSSLQQKKAGQVTATGGMATSMKVMMFIMPVMMAIFAIQYASIFTLYMVTNSAISIGLNFLSTAIIKLIDKRRTTRNYGIASGSTRGVIPSKNSDIIHYVKGGNPNAGKRETVASLQPSPDAGKKVKKKGGGQSATVRRDGRPDPNDLMNIDMSNNGKNKK